MKNNYAKLITACCFLFLFVNVGLPSTSFSVYQPYLVALPGVGDEGGSLILSLRTLISLAAMFFVGHYYTRLDCRLAVTFGCLFTAIGFYCYSFASSVALFFVGAVFAGLGYGLGGTVGMTLLTGRWYKSRVGTAVGFAAVGSGVAGMALPPLLLRLIQGISLSAAFLAEAVLATVAAIVVFALVRNHPSDIGAHPFGEAIEEKLAAAGAEKLEHEGVQLSGVDRALMILAMAFVGVICVGALAYVSILMTSNGFDEAFAAAMLSVFGVCLTLSKLMTGELFDRIGTLRGTVLVYGMALVGLVFCCLMPLHILPLAVLAMVFFGAGTALGSTCISVWSLELSTPATRARVVRDFQVGYAIGAFVADTFPGFLAAACGSYVPTYGIIFVTTLISAIIVVRVYCKYRRV